VISTFGPSASGKNASQLAGSPVPPVVGTPVEGSPVVPLDPVTDDPSLPLVPSVAVLPFSGPHADNNSNDNNMAVRIPPAYQLARPRSAPNGPARGTWT